MSPIASYILKVTRVVFRSGALPHTRSPAPIDTSWFSQLQVLALYLTLKPCPRLQTLTVLADSVITSQNTAQIHEGTVQHHLQIHQSPAREPVEKCSVPDHLVEERLFK